MTDAQTLFSPTFVGVFKHVSVLLFRPCWCCHLALLMSFSVRFPTLPRITCAPPSCFSFLNQRPWDMFPCHLFLCVFFPSCCFLVLFCAQVGVIIYSVSGSQQRRSLLEKPLSSPAVVAWLIWRLMTFFNSWTPASIEFSVSMRPVKMLPLTR